MELDFRLLRHCKEILLDLIFAAILSLYLRNVLLFHENSATFIYHMFITVCYVAPLAGAVLADGVLGRFSPMTMFGLTLIGIGTGGIKPCVAAFGGDQFHLPRQEDLLKQFFSVFYFAICFGGLLGMFVIPALRRTVTCFNEDSCYALGFGFSAGLMFLALFFFLGGKPMYRIKEPREDVMAEFIKCASVSNHLIYCFTLAIDSTSLDRDLNPDFLVIGSPIYCEGDALDNVATKGSRWTFQASRMDSNFLGMWLMPDQIQVVNPAMVLILIPLFDKGLYPLLRRHRQMMSSPLHKMMLGGITAGLSFVAAGLLEIKLEETYPVLPRYGEAQLNIINTLPCDVDVVNPFNKLQNVSSSENYVFRAVSAKNYTSNEIFVFVPKNCDNLKLRVPGARLNVLTSELQVISVIISSTNNKLEVSAAEPDELEKSLSGKPKLRVLLLQSSPSNKNITVNIHGGVLSNHTFHVPNKKLSSSIYWELDPGRAIQANNNLKPQLFVGSRKTVNTIARLYSSRPIASNRRDTRKEDKEWITEERLNKEEETFSNEFVGNRRENEQAPIIHNIVMAGKPLGSADWKAITEEVLSRGNMINSSSIHAIIMNACCSHKKFDVGMSYFNHLTSLGEEPNIATKACFLKLCYLCCDDIVDENLILSLYDSIRSKCSILDATTAENAIFGLSRTHRWEEGVELLKMIKVTCTPNHYSYNVMVKAAFDHTEAALGWDIMSDMLRHDRRPMPMAYHAWLDYLQKCDAGSKMDLLEQMLKFLGQNDLRPTEDVAERIKNLFELLNRDVKCKGSFSTVTTRGECKSCRKHLLPVKLTKKEFEDLRDAFMKEVVIGSNVFVKTSPEELQDFKMFLQRSQPFDVVIDGLNVAYSAGVSKGNPRIFSDMLQSVVRHFVSRSQRVLLLGRKHMLSWPRRYMDYVHSNAQVFFAQNISQDDPFLLYATMHGGPNTCFLSRDLMRGHAFLLRDVNLKSCFRRWQQQHQYQLIYIENNGRVKLKHPLNFNPMAQQDRDGNWHIPYDLESHPGVFQSLEPPLLWLCLRKIS
uniref:Mitochondrial ribonuclease P catalytic subunit n=1 Tax=Timema monikensis TaxID=170555 RepID=A0A7R9HND7_9NEOP|nr:unnamed protein product [Timema monikensis]